MTFDSQLLYQVPVPPLYHLIEEKIVPVNLHFLYDCLVSSKPSVDLLRCRGVKLPFILGCPKFQPYCRVAILSTIQVIHLVLRLEMKNVHRESTVVEVLSQVWVSIVVEH